MFIWTYEGGYMDFVRRILDFFKDKVESEPNEFCSFLHKVDDDSSEYVVTVHADPTGYLVFSIFSFEEWQMVVDVCKLTSGKVEDLVREISDNDEITSIVIDPRDVD